MPSCFFRSGKRSCFLKGGLCSGFLERKAVVFSIPESRLPGGDGFYQGKTKRKDKMGYTIHDEIADTRNVLANWENNLYRIIIRANCRPKLYGTQINFIRVCSVLEIATCYRRKLVQLLKEAK